MPGDAEREGITCLKVRSRDSRAIFYGMLKRLKAGDGLGHVTSFIYILLTLLQPIDDKCKDDESEEDHVEFLETRDYPPESLQATKQSLDFVAPLVHLAVIFPRVEPRSQRRHHGFIPQRQGQLPGLVTVVRAVHVQRRIALLLTKPGQHLTPFRGVVGLSGRE